MIFNQLLLIVLLCILNVLEAAIHTENIVHIILLTLLFWDGYYISSKNVKGNPVLSQSILLNSSYICKKDKFISSHRQPASI